MYMYEAMEIAYYLIDYAYKTENEWLLSGLKLNCFLFIIQGYSLAIYDKPVFSDDIHKVGFGVMIEKTHEKFRRCGTLAIPHTHIVLNPYVYGLNKLPYYDQYELKDSRHGYKFLQATYMCDRLDKETVELIEAVFDVFSKFSLTPLTDFILNLDCYKESEDVVDINSIKTDFKNIIQN